MTNQNSSGLVQDSAEEVEFPVFPAECAGEEQCATP